MFLPIGDTPNPPKTPWVTHLLIGANVAVFLLVSLPLTMRAADLGDPLLLDYLRAMGARGAVSAQMVLDQVSAYDLFVFRHGYRPAEPSAATLFSALFLHAGWMHLAGNMLFLWIFGDNVEHRLGRLNYLLAYLGAGVAATLFFAFFVPGSQVPLVGASGAISGVLGCYFLWFPRNRVKAFVFLFPFVMDTFLIPARLVLGFYLLVDNLIPFLVNGGGGSGVAHGAHIGGFLAGLGTAAYLDRAPSRAARREVRPPPEDGPEAIARALQNGDLETAESGYFALATAAERRRLAGDLLLALGEALLAAGRHEQALSVFRRFAAERPADPALDRAYLGAGRAMVHRPRCITSAYQYFLAARDVAASPESAEAARIHLQAIERLGREG